MVKEYSRYLTSVADLPYLIMFNISDNIKSYFLCPNKYLSFRINNSWYYLARKLMPSMQEEVYCA